MGSNRGKGRELPTLDVWDEHLATVGAQLLAARLELVRDLHTHVALAYEEVSGGQGDAHISYASTLQPHVGPEFVGAIGAGAIPSEPELARLLTDAVTQR